MADRQGIDLKANVTDMKPRAEYPFITFVPFVIGILNALYSLFIWLGFFFWHNNWLLSATRSAERYSAVAVYLNIFAISCGVGAVALSNRKMYPIIGTLLCLVIEIPLLAIHHHFTGFTLRGLP